MVNEEKYGFHEIIDFLDQLEVSLIDYEESLNQNIDKSELVHIIFRYAHNLKSLLSLLKKGKSSTLIHSVESIFDLVRKQNLILPKEILEKCVYSIDLIRANLETEEEIASTQELILEFEDFYEKNLELQETIFDVELTLNESEYEILEDTISYNLQTYQLDKIIYSDTPREDFELLIDSVYDDIEDFGNVIAIQPKFTELEQTEHNPVNLKVFFSTKLDKDKLKLYIFDPVKTIKIHPKLNIEKDVNILETNNKNLKILVIDDDSYSRKTLEQILFNFGICHIVSSKEDAINLFKTSLENDEAFDLVTLDIVMNKIDGQEIIRSIRQEEKDRNIIGFSKSKIMVTSTLESYENISSFFREGSDSYIVKPVTKEKILNELKRLAFIEELKPVYEDNLNLRPKFIEEIISINQEIKELFDILEVQNDIQVFTEIYEKFYSIKNLFSFTGFSVLEKVVNLICFFFEEVLQELEKEKREYFDFRYETLTKTLVHMVHLFLKDTLNITLKEQIDIDMEDKAEQIIEKIQDSLKEFVSLDEIKELVKLDISIPEASFDDENTQESEKLHIDFILDDSTINKSLLESFEAIQQIELKLIELEENPNEKEIAREIFRFVHNLKGNFGFLGFAALENISMDIEDMLSEVIENNLEITKNLISNTLEKLDHIKNIIKELELVNIQEKPVQENNIFIEQNINKQKEEFPLQPYKEKIKRKDIRVDTEKLDQLFDLVGELIINESILMNDPDILKIKSLNFKKTVSIQNKITRELQDITMSIRMIPLDGLFNRMKRIVRDLCQKTGKEVNFIISGQETEMDKNIIEELTDPLIHIIRNSIDHGIETEEDRIKLGKGLVATIKLSARYEGNNISISVEDDGSGLNRDKIIQKAIEKGFILNTTDELRDEDIWKYIFNAGFSTVENISEISGRGVGLDIVKKNIEKLRGRIIIKSAKDVGTVFTLKIPLTLAIIDGMVLSVAGVRYAIPVLSIKKIFRPATNEITKTMDGQELVKIRDELYPVVRLHEIFKKEAKYSNLEDGILIMVESQNKNVCFFVDEIYSQQQIVVKGFNNYLKNVKGLMGFMILGNGDVGLILDINAIVDMSEY